MPVRGEVRVVRKSGNLAYHSLHAVVRHQGNEVGRDIMENLGGIGQFGGYFELPSPGEFTVEATVKGMIYQTGRLFVVRVPSVGQADSFVIGDLTDWAPSKGCAH